MKPTTISKTRFNKTALASAVAMAICAGGAMEQSQADVYTFSFTYDQTPGTAFADAAFTMLSSSGAPLLNTDGGGPPYYSGRTPISGTLVYDTDGTDATGTMSINGFSFFGGGQAVATTVTLATIGDGFGNPGSLILGNMGFNWSGNNGIPVSIVWDGSGLMDAIGNGATTADVISGVGALAATESTTFGTAMNNYTLALGPSPIVTTTWNTTNIGSPTLGTNPSGTLPLITDTVGGSPMQQAVPFNNFNANFDFSSLTLDSVSDTTPPVVTLNGAADMTVTQGGAYSEPGATCTDAVNNTSLSVTVGGDTVDTATAADYIVTYDCTDGTNAATQKTRVVHVVAAGVPSMSLNSADPLDQEAGTVFTDPTTCTDPEDGPITPLGGTFTPPQDFSVTGTVNTGALGPYNLTYSCIDSDGNSAPALGRTVNVVDTTDPVITLTPSCVGGIVITAGDADPNVTATASDSFEGNLTGSIAFTDSNPAFTTMPAAFITSPHYQLSTLNWTVADSSGNSDQKSCAITVGNPVPVVTLNGTASDTATAGVGYTDPGATCADFNPADPTNPTSLGAATPDTVIDASTPAGPDPIIITYSCTDADNNTGTATRAVTVAGASDFIAAPTTSGSVFVMVGPTGKLVGEVATDITAFWNGSLNTDQTAAPDPNIFRMSSALPTPFFGEPWIAHDIRVFGPGDYTFDVDCTPAQLAAGTLRCPVTDVKLDGSGNLEPEGREITINVAPNQIGAHILFDWSTSKNIDVGLVWDINGPFIGAPADATNTQGTKGTVYNLVSSDNNGDGSPGILMADGPFKGFHANFNINFTPAYSLPAATAAVLEASQGGATTRTIITSGGTVSITGDAGSTFDWSGSDAALVTAAGGVTDGSTFSFDPAGLAAGVYTVQLTVNPGTSDEATSSMLLSILTADPGVDVGDTDNDGIANYQDIDPTGATPTAIQTNSSGTDNVVSSAGKLSLGATAFASGASGVGIDGSGLATDPGADSSCIGGCFDFEISGLPLGSSANVVLPLSAPIPAGDVVYRKLVGGTWRNFIENADNALASAGRVGGVCPAPGSMSYLSGLNEGTDCVQLTISDGGSNDADGFPNGIITDPGGVAIAAAPVVEVSRIGSPDTGGCTIGNTGGAAKYADWWLVGGFVALLGWMRRKVNR